MKNMKISSRLKTYMIWLFWAVLWQAAHLAIQNDVIFVGSFDMLGALWQLLPEVSFWQTLLHSFFKISAGFLMAFVLGILLGWASYACSFVKDLLEPPMLLIRSVPVASFVILALIWIGSDGLSVFISFLVVIPMIYTGTLTGLEHTDRELLEMSRVFSFSFFKRLRYIYSGRSPLSFKQLPYGSWDELEIRSCGRGDRHTSGVDRRAALLFQALSGYSGPVCLDLCHYCDQRCL